MTVMTKQEQHLMKSNEGRLKLVKSYVIENSMQSEEDKQEYIEAIRNAFKVHTKNKRSRKLWRKHCKDAAEARILASMTNEERESMEAGREVSEPSLGLTLAEKKLWSGIIFVVLIACVGIISIDFSSLL